MQVVNSIVLFGVRTPLIGDYIETCNRLNRVVVAAVKLDSQRDRLTDREYLVRLEDVTDEHRKSRFIAAAFSSKRRQEIVTSAIENGFSIDDALIDPTSVVASSSSIGVGSYINGMSIVASGSRIGEHVFINRACNVGHHVIVGDYASIGPGVSIASSVTIGEGAGVGIGATLLPGVKVGEGAIVSAATCLNIDVPPNCLAVGNPPVIKSLNQNKRAMDYSDQE